MKYISPNDFINSTINKAFDMDGAYGVQCVDAIKKFVTDVYGNSDFSCGNGWAYGLWTCYGSNGVEKYFDKYPYSEAKKGDWVIWNTGSKEAPKSHVAMFVNKESNGRVKVYGQNQNGNKYFCYVSVSEHGILGVLRPKIYVNNFLGPRGYLKEGDSGESVEKLCSFISEKIKGNWFGPNLKAYIMGFQKENGLEVDGCIGPITLSKLKENGFKE